MIINDNGIDREATPEEIEAWESQQAEFNEYLKKVADLQKKKIKVLEKLGLTNDELTTFLS